MRTPYGADCKYYYADFHRGRQTQECRLPRRDRPNEKWTPDLCRACPVPRLLLANACPHLTFSGRIDRGFLGLNRKMIVEAACNKSGGPVAEPAVGCGQCHEDSPPIEFKLE
ncbi:MAG: hypothetical protein HYZ49_08490 [Chloroflexi bacterium]|nr:hypothetical protein [Chloroflexota bacterium]